MKRSLLLLLLRTSISMSLVQQRLAQVQLVVRTSSKPESKSKMKIMRDEKKEERIVSVLVEPQGLWESGSANEKFSDFI